MCLLFRQNGGDGFHQAKNNLIPQRFNIHVWISQKNPFRTKVFRGRPLEDLLEKGFWEVITIEQKEILRIKPPFTLEFNTNVIQEISNVQII